MFHIMLQKSKLLSSLIVIDVSFCKICKATTPLKCTAQDLLLVSFYMDSTTLQDVSNVRCIKCANLKPIVSRQCFTLCIRIKCPATNLLPWNWLPCSNRKYSRFSHRHITREPRNTHHTWYLPIIAVPDFENVPR